MNQAENDRGATKWQLRPYSATRVAKRKHIIPQFRLAVKGGKYEDIIAQFQLIVKGLRHATFHLVKQVTSYDI